VVLDAKELAEIQRFARRQRMTTAEWVRQVLRAAGHHAFPAPGIDQMLREIERGYQGKS
jgi:hypothetical protein